MMKKVKFDFTNYPVSKLEKIICNGRFEGREKVFHTATVRCNKLNQDFVFNDYFFDHFVLINDRLTILMSESYDKKLSIRTSLKKLIDEKQILIDDFDLEGFIDYEDQDTMDIEIPK
ncbi:hypothetical protein [Petrimonas mucosa]|jgi:hypothetical protein|uniref:Uncharacterized protein n=1 Tax=Petrimonas mucosa TaxID=1642646 RepID=A0A1G4G3E6_9BACT|nr:hypothetical protein [Petrimonas mucosa]SCM55297.1 hypothetical protein ING2E5A_0218 [Petrimonas mucosa]